MAFSLVGLGPCRLLPGGASGRAGYMQVTTCMSRTGSSVPGVQPLALRARFIYDAHHMSTPTAGQPAPSIKEVIDVVARHSPDQGKPGVYERALVTVATMVGALMLARAVDDPKLSEALRQASLKHFDRTGT